MRHTPKMGDRVDRYPIAGDDRDLYPKPEIDVDRCPITVDDRDSEGRNRWEKPIIAFTFLKAKIATTPILSISTPIDRL